MKLSRFLTIILLISAILLQGSAFGQKKIKKADDAALYYQYTKAIPYLEAVVKKDNKYKTKAMVLLANCYRYMNNAGKAGEWYAQVVYLPGVEPVNHYYYGQILRTLGKYDLALEQFLVYDSLVPGDPRGKLYASYCEKIRSWDSLPPSAEISNAAALNTGNADFSPVLYKHGVVFASDRPAGQSNLAIYDWTGAPYLDIYMADFDSVANPLSANFRTPGPFPGKINQLYHDGPAIFSPGGDTIYFTRTISERVKKDKDRIFTHILKIFYSYSDSGNWRDPEPFFLNDSMFSVGHPSLSKDGETLYFASDMPGSFGGTDLYMCKWEGETWALPKNLGPVINTPGDEMFPFLYDTVLYFSSTGHLGYGGLDIFKSELHDAIWTEPVNMMAPVNSSYDDFGITLYPDLQMGFLSSNRPGGKGSDDIYAFELIKPIEPTILAGYVVGCTQEAVLSGLIRDKQTLQSIAGATVFALNKKTNTVLIAKTDDSGRYSFHVDASSTYVVKGMKEGYLSDCYAMMSKNRPQHGKDLLLDKFEVNKVFKLENIYYDLDKWNIRKDAAAELDKLVTIMKENPIKIELSSHTDCRASNEYNERLSQRRAEAAVQYIISKGVQANRLVAKGYGESKLVNRCADGVTCSEAEHQQNRRTEFTILEITKQPTTLFKTLDQFAQGEVYQSSQFDKNFFASCAYFSPEELADTDSPGRCDRPLANATVFVLSTQTNKVQILKTDEQGHYEMEVEPGVEYVVKARKEGYLGDCLTSLVGEVSVLNEDLKLTKYELEQVFEVENIYYDLDKWDIRSDAKPSLDEVVAFMNENPVTIELSSHTDCRASDKYNLNLSQKRAESAVNYIILQGINPSRITARGYGETRLVNQCADGVKCTDEEHQMNRRTEFKITGTFRDDSPAMESLDRYEAGDTFDRKYFAVDYFDNCPVQAPLFTGKDALTLRNWEEFAPQPEPIVTPVIPVQKETPSEQTVQPQPVVPPVNQVIEAEPKPVMPPPVTISEPVTPSTVTPKVQPVTGNLFTVQIAAGKSMDISNFKGVPGVKKCLGKDGLYRFTVGAFKTQQEANVLKNQLRSQGYPDAFVAKVDENRSNCE